MIWHDLNLNLKDNENGQVIALAGFAIALSIIIFATVFHSAGMAGQRSIEQETDDISFIFSDVRSTYGRVLFGVSNYGADDPFNGSNFVKVNTSESQMKKLISGRGCVLVFSGHNYSSSNRIANVTITLFDGETKYLDTVTYNLTVGS